MDGREVAISHPPDQGDETLTDCEITTALESALGSDFTEAYQAFIVNGAPLPPGDLAPPSCLTSTAEENCRVIFTLNDASEVAGPVRDPIGERQCDGASRIDDGRNRDIAEAIDVRLRQDDRAGGAVRFGKITNLTR